MSREDQPGRNAQQGFIECTCAQGSLVRITVETIMLLALSHAGELVKFGP